MFMSKSLPLMTQHAARTKVCWLVGWSPNWFSNSHLSIGRWAAINHRLLHILGTLLWVGLETFLSAGGSDWVRKKTIEEKEESKGNRFIGNRTVKDIRRLNWQCWCNSWQTRLKIISWKCIMATEPQIKFVRNKLLRNKLLATSAKSKSTFPER